MIIHAFSLLALGTVLTGLLACASSGRDRSRLHVQRNAELDRLGEQAGMPEPWLPHDLKAAAAGLLRGKQPLSGERIE